MKRHPKTSTNNLRFLLFLLFIVLLGSCKKDDTGSKPKTEGAEVVLKWYRFVANLQLHANPQPVYLLIHRNFGYIGVGLYEAVRPGISNAKSLSSVLYQMPAMPQIEAGKEYLWSASANAALASMFRQFLTGLSNANKASIDSMEAAQNTQLSSAVSSEVITRSQLFGRSVATAIYNWSTTDNFSLSSAGYTLPTGPDKWVPTPPAFANPSGAFLKDSRPFLSYSLTATAPPLPFAFSTDPSSEFYKAAKEVYDIGRALTTEQKAIANWWADAGGAGVGVPAPYHTLGIITRVLEAQKADLEQAAIVYAKTGIAIKDGPINVFRAKFQNEFSLLRPVTYIQRHIDPAWQSFLVNPPYSEYPSGLISVYGPVAQVLIRQFGDIPVTDNSYDWRGLPGRSFPSISKMAEEAALSRLYAGIHYKFTQYVTLDMGRGLGNIIADINLKN